MDRCEDSPTGKHLWGKFHYADGGMSFTKCKHCMQSKKQAGVE